jgi:putative transposase
MPYLSRKLLIGYSDLYHIFNRSDSAKKLFNESRDYDYFLKLLRAYCAHYNFSVYHWVLMPDHYHLLVKIDKPAKLSSCLAGMGRAYVYYYHKKYRTYGHLWQGRFKSQGLRQDKCVLSCGRYIERNPVEEYLTDYPFSYNYSSAGYYALGQKDGLTSQNPLFRIFGLKLSRRRQRYRTFLCMSDFRKEEPFRRLEFPNGAGRFNWASKP